jgi:alpha-tubulin suppressor-like RCC1 family protein
MVLRKIQFFCLHLILIWLLCSVIYSGADIIRSGFLTTCAVTNAGAMYCWGDNSYRQVGDGTIEARLSPTAVFGMSSSILSVGTALAHSCALTSGGSMFCWRKNINSELGDGTTDNPKLTPVQVSSMTSDGKVFATGYYHTCAVILGGSMFCWGANGNSQLGDGTNTSTSVPVPVLGMSSGVTAIDAGEYHTCAIQAEGGYCWGLNSGGQ